MINLLRVTNISKEEVKEKICKIIDSMSSHNFKKLKNMLNKAGVFDDIRK